MANAKKGIAALALLLGVAGAHVAVSVTGGEEGKRNAPYMDGIGARAIATVCYGETHVQMRRYTDAECLDMLADRLVEVYGQLAAAVPGFGGIGVGPRVALLDYTYNRGIGAVSRASGPKDPPNVLALYRARDPAMCDAFAKWGVVKRGGAWVDCRVRANGCYGIYARRLRERDICKGEVTE